MSDLQCPARFILLTSLDGSASGAFAHERVAGVYAAPPAAATELAAAGFEVSLHISSGTAHGIAPDGLDFATSFMLAQTA